MRARTRRLLKGMLRGAVAGLAGTIVMTGFQSEMSKAVGKKKADPEEKKDEPSTVQLAQGISKAATGHRMEDKKTKGRAGQIVHYAFGTAMGATYGLLAEMEPGVTSGLGLAYGAALWLIADEIAIPALGLGKGPGDAPISSHVNGLASHLVYGGAVEGFRRMVA